MDYKITEDRILLEKIQEKNITFAGIIIPDNVLPKADRGLVKGTGPGKKNKDGTFAEIAVAVGDTVVFTQNTGTPIRINGEDYLLIREDEILAIEG